MLVCVVVVFVVVISPLAVLSEVGVQELNR